MPRQRPAGAIAAATVARMRVAKAVSLTILCPLLVAMLLASACQAGAAGQQAPGQPLDVELEPLYQPWERVLAAYVDDEGLVDYEDVSSPPTSTMRGSSTTRL